MKTDGGTTTAERLVVFLRTQGVLIPQERTQCAYTTVLCGVPKNCEDVQVWSLTFLLKPPYMMCFT
jgi:hypothetical protein